MWWKTFFDPTEPDWLFRRHSMGGLWTLMWLAALCVLIGILGPASLPYLVLPTALCGLYVFLSYVTGIAGMVVFSPILAYGWLCLAWFTAYGYPVVGSIVGLLEGLLVAMLMVVFVIGAPHVRANLLAPVVCEGMFFACVSYALFWLSAPDPDLMVHHAELDLLARRVASIYFVGVNAMSLTIVISLVYQFSRHLGSYPEAMRQCIADVALFFAGCAITLVAALLCRLHAVLGAMTLLLGFGALAVLATRKRIEQMGWALVAPVLLATLTAIALAPVDYLPSYGPGAAAVLAIHDGPLGAFAQAAVLPLLRGLTSVLGPAVLMLLRHGLDFFSWVGAPLYGVVGPVAAERVASEAAVVPESQRYYADKALSWQMTELPQDSALLMLLCLYLGVFLIAAVMGTIRGVADVRAYLGASASADAAASSVPSASVPGWLTFDPLRKALRKRRGANGEDEEALSQDDAPEEASSKQGLIDRAFPRELRYALGFPTAPRVKRARWDEQLSGQPIGLPGAHISQIEHIRLRDRQRRGIKAGLWWKAFEDDGRLAIIPKGDLFGTILLVTSTCGALLFANAVDYGYLAVPLALIALTIGMGYVLGSVGIVASGPLLAYAWSTIFWSLMLAKEGNYPVFAARIDPARGIAVLFILSFYTPAMRRSMGGGIALVYYTIGVTWFCAHAFTDGSQDEATVRLILDAAYGVSVAFALVFVVRSLLKELDLLRRFPQIRADELKSVLLVGSGVVPLLVARALTSVGPLAAMLGATVCYVALAMAGRLYSAKGLSCPLLLLMVCMALGLVARADVSRLPLSWASDMLLRISSPDALMAPVTSGSMAILDGFVTLAGGAANGLGLALSKLLGSTATQFPEPTVGALCLLPAIIMLASAMGMGVSVLEKLQPQLVSKQLRAEGLPAEGENLAAGEDLATGEAEDAS